MDLRHHAAADGDGDDRDRSAVDEREQRRVGADWERLALAEKSGVRRAVVLAATNVDDDPARQPSRYRGDFNREAERAVTASGMAWASLRPTLFATNMIGLWAGQNADGDIVHGPYAHVSAAPIDERDIAEVAAHALRRDDLLGRRLELTGPESLTQDDMVAVVGTAIGRPLRFQEVAPDTARRAMVAQGFPEAFADAYLRLQAEAARAPAPVTGTVAEVLGRQPGTFVEWATRHRRAFLTGARPRVPGTAR